MKRIEAARATLGKLDGILVDSPIDLYYLTGLELSLGRLLITQKEATLFVDGRYFEKCQKESPIPVVLWDRKSPLPITGKVGFDSLYTTYNEYQTLCKLDVKWEPLCGPIQKLRLIKEPAEIEKLRVSAALCAQGYDYVLTLLKEGVIEEEVAMELELFWRKIGGEELSFEPIIAFGENSSLPHHRPSKRALQHGDLVLIDIGVRYDHYHSDMTRVTFFGEPTTQMEEIYSIVKEAYVAALALCRPGQEMAVVDRAARQLIESRGYDLPHSLGHGVGLEVHEMPRIYASSEGTLQAGMVITIEPGIYVPGFGGVRLEDTIVITGDGYESLTCRPLSESLTLLNNSSF